MEEFERNIPVYLQVVDLFYTLIVSNNLKPGDQIPPVRKLAADWGVNPNTIQKALQVLEQEEITMAQIGRGRFVTEDMQKIAEVKEKLLHTEMNNFYTKMQQFGLTIEQLQKEFENFLRNLSEEEKRNVRG